MGSLAPRHRAANTGELAGGRRVSELAILLSPGQQDGHPGPLHAEVVRPRQGGASLRHLPRGHGAPPEVQDDALLPLLPPALHLQLAAHQPPLPRLPIHAAVR